jgi:hypothetical protein
MIYCRYRDDILIVYEDEKVFSGVFGWNETKSKRSLDIEIGGTKQRKIYYLDITIFKGEFFQKEGLLQYKPYIKGSSQKTPLSASSSHAINVHLSWPAGEVRRIARRSMNEQDFEEAKEKKLK